MTKKNESISMEKKVSSAIITFIFWSSNNALTNGF